MGAIRVVQLLESIYICILSSLYGLKCVPSYFKKFIIWCVIYVFFNNKSTNALLALYSQLFLRFSFYMIFTIFFKCVCVSNLMFQSLQQGVLLYFSNKASIVDINSLTTQMSYISLLQIL